MVWLVESVGLQAKAFAYPQEFVDSYDSSRTGRLILDIRMPEISGLDLIEELGTQDIKIPVIVATAYGEVATAVSALMSGAAGLFLSLVPTM